ncbi:unnamed protein product [Meloidogyne enterolobii]|uniref:Uncharacterized protein n=1 Tax=Meloidogyne enterolobii TaxID=390850 RepID=A0ACB1AXB0_MELEN
MSQNCRENDRGNMLMRLYDLVFDMVELVTNKVRFFHLADKTPYTYTVFTVLEPHGALFFNYPEKGG